MQHEPVAELPLREIHAAPPPEWWPPPVGWWLVAALLLALLLVLAVWGYRTWRRRQRVRALQERFARVLRQYREDEDVNVLLASTADFLRRLQVHVLDDPSLRTASGDEWAAALLAVMGPRAGDDHRQAARALAVDRFRAQAAPPPTAALQQLVDCWILRSTSGASR